VDEKDYKIANQIQLTVFENEFINEKSKDNFQHTLTVLVYNEEDLAVATGELVLINYNEVEIRSIAVLPEYQNRGYGDVTVRMLVNKAMVQGFDTILLKAQKNNIKFFEKIGFVTANNDNKTNKYTFYDMKY